MKNRNIKEAISVCLYSIALALLITGCASTPDSTDVKESTAVFYPPYPNPPRIQFLTSYSGKADIEQEERSNFASFILGKGDKPTGQLVKPYGVALADNKIHAVDTRGNGYVIFDLNNKRYHAIRGLIKPINITIDQDGAKYVTDTSKDQILVYDRNDRLIRAFGTPGNYKPTDVAILADKLFVSDIRNQQIQVLNKATGEKIFTIGSKGSADGQLLHPTNLAIGDNGNIFVSDTGNFRVQEFTPDGRFVRRLGTIGTSFGKFARPKGIALDREGRIYVVDAAFQNVQLFDVDGRLLMYFAGPGVGPGQLYLPTDISIDYNAAAYFQSYAEPGFQLEYVILVSNQFGPNKINVYGFGKTLGGDSP